MESNDGRATGSPNPRPDDHPLHRLMQHVVRRSIAELHTLLQDLHLSLPQLGTLHFLRAEGDQSVSSIAHHVGLSLAATSHLVDRLVGRGLLTRREDPADRRQKRIGLDTDGRALVERIQTEAAGSLDDLLAAIPPELRRRLDDDLREILALLETDTGREPRRSPP